MIFQRFNQNKNKRKIEKPLPPHPQTAQGGYVNGFVSMRRLDGRFYCPKRKKQIRPKIEGGKKKFFFLMEDPAV